MSALADIAQMTDVDRVTKMVAAAANRMRALESEAESAFPVWLEAQVEAEKAGLVVDMKLGAGMAAALSEFKQRRERVEAREIASEEMGGWPRREEAA